MEIIEVYAMLNHIHMLVRVSPKLSVSGFMGYLKERSAVIIHERHANLKYNYGNRLFWAKGYYVSSVGVNKKTLRNIYESKKQKIK